MPEQKPLNIFLIFVLIGTSILATAGTIGLFAFFGSNDFGRLLSEPLGLIFLAIISVGYILFAGYILTAIYKKHSQVFWLCSMLYNLAFSLIYLLFVLGDGGFTLSKSYEFNPILLALSWTSFVTYSSWYYFNYARNQKRMK